MCTTSTEINATCTSTVQSVKHSNKTILCNWKYSERCILLLQLHPALCMEAHRVRTYPDSNVNAIYILFLPFFFFPIRNWYLKQAASCNNHYAELNAKRNTNAPARSPGRQQEGTAEPLRPPEARTATPAKQGKKGTQRTFHAGATPGRPEEVAAPTRCQPGSTRSNPAPRPSGLQDLPTPPPQPNPTQPPDPPHTCTAPTAARPHERPPSTPAREWKWRTADPGGHRDWLAPLTWFQSTQTPLASGGGAKRRPAATPTGVAPSLMRAEKLREAALSRVRCLA